MEDPLFMTPVTETKCCKDRFWSQCNILLLKNNLLDWLQDAFHTVMYADNTLTLENKSIGNATEIRIQH